MPEALPLRATDAAVKDAIEARRVYFEGQARDFLENAPLYVPRDFDGGTGMNRASFPAPKAIKRRCDTCKEETTWVKQDPATPGHGMVHRYECAQCAQQSVWFWLTVVYLQQEKSSNLTLQVQKIGQDPPWDISTPSELRNELSGTSPEFFRKGQINASQGYGIGALAYMRRVVEDEANAIVDLVEEVARTDGDEAAVAKIAQARSSYRGTELLAIAKDALPPSLRVAGGANPLQVMWDDFSAGIHRLSEEESLELALELRDVLVRVLKEMRAHQAERRAFEKKVQERAGKRIPKK